MLNLEEPNTIQSCELDSPDCRMCYMLSFEIQNASCFGCSLVIRGNNYSYWVCASYKLLLMLPKGNWFLQINKYIILYDKLFGVFKSENFLEISSLTYSSKLKKMHITACNYIRILNIPSFHFHLFLTLTISSRILRLH